MKPQGVIAFHVTNRYLELKSVVKLLAQARGLQALNVADSGDSSHFGSSTDWVLVTRSPEVFKAESLAGETEEIEVPAGQAIWTDDFNNLYQVLK